MLLGINRPLLVKQTDLGQAVGVDVAAVGLSDLTIYVRWDDTSTAGEVTVETADDVAFTGTWAPIQVVSWAGANRQDVVRLTGGLSAVRTRITASIVGGTVSTRATGSL